MTLQSRWRLALVLGGALALSGCTEGAPFPFLKKSGDAPAAEAAANVKLVERDVEAPEAFQATDSGLWDGRPSLGGVWVAHPDVKEPERVIIRNEANGKFVIGALFRRENPTPGPRFQISSDAAVALEMLAGQPGKLNVTALRREEAPDPAVQEETKPLAKPEEIKTKKLDPIASAAAALDKVEAEAKPAAPDAVATPPKPKPTTAAAPNPAPKPAPAAATAASALTKPFIQIGIYNIESNATRTAANLRKSGIIPLVKKGESKGKTFWRVLVGPATSTGERASLLKNVRGAGFADAYFVTN